MSDLNWDRRFLRLAEQVSGWSKDPSSQVGAVAVRDLRVLATGCIGFPRGVADDGRLNDRAEKYPRIVHAEQNVIAWAARQGVSLEGSTIYIHPPHPCPDCAKLLVQAGVQEVVFSTHGDTPERWKAAFEVASDLLGEAGVSVREVPKA
jgi:dCMP deaminase